MQTIAINTMDTLSRRILSSSSSYSLSKELSLKGTCGTEKFGAKRRIGGNLGYGPLPGKSFALVVEFVSTCNWTVSVEVRRLDP